MIPPPYMHIHNTVPHVSTVHIYCVNCTYKEKAEEKELPVDKFLVLYKIQEQNADDFNEL